MPRATGCRVVLVPPPFVWIEVGAHLDPDVRGSILLHSFFVRGAADHLVSGLPMPRFDTVETTVALCYSQSRVLMVVVAALTFSSSFKQKRLLIAGPNAAKIHPTELAVAFPYL